VVGTRLDLADTGAVAGLGYVPLPLEPLEATHERLDPSLPRGTVRTVMAITSDVRAAAHHGEAADVEHMETYGAALACAEAGVPFSVVLAVANRVGPSAHAEWLANRERAEEAARAVARQWLASAGQFLSLEPPTAR
jgi:nucleoside phosphorylase